MSKRGLSREEKRTKMLEIFHETSGFFTLKELEKIAPKQKGIVQQSVKEILDELVSDGLVTFDKIGTSNYFWAFPSTAGAAKQVALDRTSKEAASIHEKITETHAAIKDASRDREDTAERRKLLVTLDGLQSNSAKLKAELAAYGAADPVRYERKLHAVNVAREAAVRWTENTLTLIYFFKSINPYCDESDLRLQFGISETWEDIETT